MSEFGKEIDEGFDHKGYQRKRRCDAVVECPRCHAAVDLWSDTEAWVEMTPEETGAALEEEQKRPHLFRAGLDPRWKHTEYGPSTGYCCGLVFVDSFDGCMTFGIPARQATP